MAQDRQTFQVLAEERLAEARLLLANGHPSGAYYLAGYAIECGLKAKIAKGFRENQIPDLKRVRDIYVHDLGKLMSHASLIDELEANMKNDPNLARSWAVVAGWSEQARYHVATYTSAEALLNAIGGEKGLLQWLRYRW